MFSGLKMVTIDPTIYEDLQERRLLINGQEILLGSEVRTGDFYLTADGRRFLRFSLQDFDYCLAWDASPGFVPRPQLIRDLYFSLGQNPLFTYNQQSIESPLEVDGSDVNLYSELGNIGQSLDTFFQHDKKGNNRVLDAYVRSSEATLMLVNPAFNVTFVRNASRGTQSAEFSSAIDLTGPVAQLIQRTSLFNFSSSDLVPLESAVAYLLREKFHGKGSAKEYLH